MVIILGSRKISTETRITVLKAYTWPIVKYTDEAWNIGKEEERRINGFELWCYRKMQSRGWTDKKSNVEMLN